MRWTTISAVQLSGVAVDGDFLMSKSSVIDTVRMASPFHSRSIENVHPRELQLAVRNVVRDAAGVNRAEVSEAVARALGWNKTSAAIAAAINEAIDQLANAGELREAGTRLAMTTA